MESLLQRLFNYKTIPYISKKYINDELGEYVLRNTPNSFLRTVLPEAITALDTLCVVKGGAAAATHLHINEPSHLTDIDLEVYVDDERVTVDNLRSFVALKALEERLKKVCEKYYDEIDAILAAVDMNRLMYNNYTRDSMIIFKSYVNEAIQVQPDHVRFCLNRAQPFKSTVSLVNDDYFLVRYSFNVHMKSASSPMWLYKSKNNEVQNLKYFPFDVYFLDLSVKRTPGPYVDCYSLARLYDISVYVENLKYLIADQLECLLFNVFNHHWHKIDNRIARVSALLEAAATTTTTATVAEMRRYDEIIRDSSQRFTVRDVKQLLYALGPLGPRALIELYFMHRFDNSIRHITHQVNFPYHRWEPDYFSKCWKQFLSIVNKLYKLGYNIQQQNN
ncbi:asb043 [Agrotis segetum nucleopolyhedrovirus B]|uniref:Asb043 n=1 Tax=Agrotis segetum nucleopolyhedrovirus B TaxID=1580580 RepID=A0A0A7KTC0_9ABAC|nr:asb043 [Agrotis segetum nucleopolyhedrovirus B]AIZ48601.1 asb043 [Agrotis segetum nucleopolyhedrovirus B]